MNFKVGNSVRIIPIERTGRILGTYTGKHGTEFHVRYFDNATACTVYFMEDELELLGNFK